MGLVKAQKPPQNIEELKTFINQNILKERYKTILVMFIVNGKGKRTIAKQIPVENPQGSKSKHVNHQRCGNMLKHAVNQLRSICNKQPLESREISKLKGVGYQGLLKSLQHATAS